MRNNNITHIPYRTWCPICVGARSKRAPHKQIDQKDSGAEIHVDYVFFRNKKG